MISVDQLLDWAIPFITIMLIIVIVGKVLDRTGRK